MTIGELADQGATRMRLAHWNRHDYVQRAQEARRPTSTT